MLIVEVNDKLIINHPAPDAFLLGIEGFSSECYHHFSADEALRLARQIKDQGKGVYIDLTSMYHDQDALVLNDLIKTFNFVDGFLYHDFLVQSLIPFAKRVYYAPTYMTNLIDFNLMKEECQYVLASPEVDFKSLKAMSSNETWYLAFGTWEIFHSRRPLLTNYFKYRGWKNEGSVYTLKEEFRPNEEYPIIEERGTKIYLNDFYYLGREIGELRGHFLIKSFNLPVENVNAIINIYHEALIKNDGTNILPQLQALSLHLHQGFLYQKAILLKGDVSDE